MVSATHNVSAKGFYVAMVSTTVETNNPEAELKPGLDLLGEIREKYVSLVLLLIVINNYYCYNCYRSTNLPFH